MILEEGHLQVDESMNTIEVPHFAKIGSLVLHYNNPWLEELFDQFDRDYHIFQYYIFAAVLHKCQNWFHLSRKTPWYSDDELWKHLLLAQQRDYLILSLLDAVTAQRNRGVTLNKLISYVRRRFLLLPLAEKQIISLTNAWRQTHIL